jgi:hypothetical protein
VPYVPGYDSHIPRESDGGDPCVGISNRQTSPFEIGANVGLVPGGLRVKGQNCHHAAKHPVDIPPERF